jgi:GNAT superfamily N-acetyltransferase
MGREDQNQSRIASVVRPCCDDDRDAMLAVINTAAEAYRGVIPTDRWHVPYMRLDEFDGEIAAGVKFWGYVEEGRLVGVMGIQSVRDVDLIRHAYVVPGSQRQGVGGELLQRLRRLNAQPMLVGTWAAAEWAVRFYQRHGFELVSAARKSVLLKRYWNIPDRQIETSVVLANPPDNEPET